MCWRVRCLLLLVVGGLVGIYALAWELNPHDAAGRPLWMETHRQLGLPPCTFYRTTRVPCPSCGMTTSLCHLVRGNVANAVRANATGTLLGVCGAAAAIWFAASALTGRRLGVRDYPVLVAWSTTAFLVVFFVGWGLQLAVRWVVTGSVSP